MRSDSIARRLREFTPSFAKRWLRRGFEFLYLISHHNSLKIRGKRNRLQSSGCLMRNVSLDLRGDNCQLTFWPGSRLTDVNIYIRGSGHILDVGQGCRFSGDLWFEDSGCTIRLGDRTSVYGVHLAVTESGSSIEIGSNCLLSRGIEIRTGDSHSIIDATTGTRINEPVSVQIADHVWIGANVTVLKGVTIGQDSVVGTGAIVTKAVPSGVVAAGVPARIIRRNVNWTSKRTSIGTT